MIVVIAVVAAISISVFRWVRPPAEPVSVLLITLDTIRADHLGCYGRDPRQLQSLGCAAGGQSGTQDPALLRDIKDVLSVVVEARKGDKLCRNGQFAEAPKIVREALKLNLTKEQSARARELLVLFKTAGYFG